MHGGGGRGALLGPFLERMVGVSYIKASERESHHVQCSLPRQFDAWIHINTTTAVVHPNCDLFPVFPFLFGGWGGEEGSGLFGLDHLSHWGFLGFVLPPSPRVLAEVPKLVAC